MDWSSDKISRSGSQALTKMTGDMLKQEAENIELHLLLLIKWPELLKGKMERIDVNIYVNTYLLT